jgi:hypothetical protein
MQKLLDGFLLDTKAQMPVKNPSFKGKPAKKKTR